MYTKTQRTLGKNEKEINSLLWGNKALWDLANKHRITLDQLFQDKQELSDWTSIPLTDLEVDWEPKTL